LISVLRPLFEAVVLVLLQASVEVVRLFVLLGAQVMRLQTLTEAVRPLALLEVLAVRLQAIFVF